MMSQSKSEGGGAGGKIFVCLRMDDYASTTPLAVVRELATILQKHQAVCVFSVIPFLRVAGDDEETPITPLAQPAVDLLRELMNGGLVVPALHGFVHERHANGKEEFGHGDVEDQRRRIARGKASLESLLNTRIEGFVPPWNVVTAETEVALRDLGFTYVSTALSLEVASHWNLVDVPLTAHWMARSAVTTAAAHLTLDPVVVYAGHFTDFAQDDGSPNRRACEDFDQMLTWLRSRPDVEIVSLDQARDRCLSHSNARRAINRCRAAMGIPHRLRQRLRWPKWMPTQGLSPELAKIRRAAAMFWMAVAGFALLVGTGFAALRPSSAPLATGTLLAAGVFSERAVRSEVRRATTRVILAVVAGTLAGSSLISLAHALRP